MPGTVVRIVKHKKKFPKDPVQNVLVKKYLGKLATVVLHHSGVGNLATAVLECPGDGARFELKAGYLLIYDPEEEKVQKEAEARKLRRRREKEALAVERRKVERTNKLMQDAAAGGGRHLSLSDNPEEIFDELDEVRIPFMYIVLTHTVTLARTLPPILTLSLSFLLCYAAQVSRGTMGSAAKWWNEHRELFVQLCEESGIGEPYTAVVSQENLNALYRSPRFSAVLNDNGYTTNDVMLFRLAARNKGVRAFITVRHTHHSTATTTTTTATNTATNTATHTVTRMDTNRCSASMNKKCPSSSTSSSQSCNWITKNYRKTPAR